MPRAAVIAASTLALLVLASCGPPKPKVYSLAIASMAFGAAPPELHVGDTVEFVNADMFRHTATARDGGFDLDLAPKSSGRAVLRHAGSIEVYCRFHPGMTTRLAVAP